MVLAFRVSGQAIAAIAAPVIRASANQSIMASISLAQSGIPVAAGRFAASLLHHNGVTSCLSAARNRAPAGTRLVMLQSGAGGRLALIGRMGGKVRGLGQHRCVVRPENLGTELYRCI